MHFLTLLLLFVTQAFAGPWAEVDVIWVEDDAGQWEMVSETGSATRTRGEQSVTLARGDELQPGDLLRTTRAKVRVRLQDGQQILVGAESELTLQERSVLQELGEVLYQVEGIFRVRHASVEAAVEGTRFRVRVLAEGGVEVQVLEGVVLVTEGARTSRVQAGEQVTATPAATQALSASPLSEAARASEKLERRRLGEPRVVVGALVAGAWVNGGPHIQTRTLARVRVSPGWRISASAGWETDAQRFHLPLAAGLERRLGPFGVGLEFVGLLGQAADCQTTRVTLLPGGAIATRARFGRFAGLELALRAGYAGGLFADVGVGVSLGR